MAGDLIPPPSPARRSDAEAEPRATAELEQATHLAADAAEGVEPSGPSPFRNRFGFVLGALAGIGACAAVGFGLLFASAGGGEGPRLAANWSDWRPGTTKMLEGAEQIAAHVQSRYLLEDGNQLVTVAPSDPAEAGLDIAVQPVNRETEFLDGEALVYNLLGAGESGMLEGEPSIERGRLLYREAIELALFSFRYLEDVSMVAVLIPASAEQEAANGATTAPRRAIFFRPGDLLDELQVPLSETLAPETPTPASMTEDEAMRIDDLALRNLFTLSVELSEGEDGYLLLKQPTDIE